MSRKCLILRDNAVSQSCVFLSLLEHWPFILCFLLVLLLGKCSKFIMIQKNAMKSLRDLDDIRVGMLVRITNLTQYGMKTALGAAHGCI